MKPRPKVSAGAAAGGVSVIVVWIASELGLEVPAEVASAFTTVLSFAAGWVTPQS